MKSCLTSFLIPVLSLFALVLTTHRAQAHGLRGGCRDGCDQCTIVWVEKTVTCYKTVWKEKEIQCTANKLVPREIVANRQCEVCTPVWKDVKRTVTICNRVPKEVEREVVVCRKVPVAPCCDDCDDGCGRCRLFQRCRQDYEIVREVKKVKCTVWECVPVQKEITSKVCEWKREMKNIQTRCTVWECKPETVTRMVRYCVRVPYETTIKVPVRVPCSKVNCCD
jgi:hypothetical protein